MLSKLFRKAKSTDTPAPQPQTRQPDQQAGGKTQSAEKSTKRSQSAKPANRNKKKPKAKVNAPSKPQNNNNESAANEWLAQDFQVPELDGETRFHDLGLPDELMHAIQDLGFEYCTPIQAQILPHSLQGKDAIGKAQTGTGKTAAFLLTILDDLAKNPIEEERYLCEPRALIIAPTRELVVQIASDAEKLSKYMGMSVVTLIGGVEYHKQKQKLSRDFVDILVATPGRLIDFMTRKDIYLDRIESLVLDEADRMLDMGFIPQVKRIVRALPDTDYRQTQLYSATFSQDILRLAKQWTYDATNIEVEPENIATDTVEQKIFMVSAEEKFAVTCNLLRQPGIKKAIIFVNRRDQAQKLYDKISASGLKAGLLSGEIAQHKRTKTLEAFKKDRLQILVATDVVGRGIHVEGVSHVINYNLPEDPEDYVHRIGRTGRAGASGISISLACEDEAFQLPAIEALLGQKLHYELAPAELLQSD